MEANKNTINPILPEGGYIVPQMCSLFFVRRIFQLFIALFHENVKIIMRFPTIPNLLIFAAKIAKYTQNTILDL